jgi:hypothetical protein
VLVPLYTGLPYLLEQKGGYLTNWFMFKLSMIPGEYDVGSGKSQDKAMDPFHIRNREEWQMERDEERNMLVQYPPLTSGDKGHVRC